MQENKITLRAYYGKQQGRFSPVPVRHKVTGKLLGVKTLSPEEARNAVRAVDANTSRDITDGLTLDLNDEVDKIDWEWIKHNKEISEDLESAKSNQSVLYYVDKPDVELDKRLNKTKAKIDALKIIENSTEIERADMFRYLGNISSGMRAKDILDYLYDKAEKNPGLILQSKKDPSFKTKLFLSRLIEERIIRKDASGTYRYGDNVLGLNEAAAIIWLDSPKNTDLVGAMYIKIHGSPDLVLPSVITNFEQTSNDEKNKAGATGNAGEATDSVTKSLNDAEVI